MICRCNFLMALIKLSNRVGRNSNLTSISYLHHFIFVQPIPPISFSWAMGSRVGGLGSSGLAADKALAGVPRLLDDLKRLSEDVDSADIVFILGREEERVFAHRVILMAR